VDDICLDGQIGVDEFGWISAIGMDASYLGGCKEYVLRTLAFEKALDGDFTGQVKFFVRTQKKIRCAVIVQAADNGTADQTAMASYVDAGIGFHRLIPVASAR
jgi:hypothetical protein